MRTKAVVQAASNIVSTARGSDLHTLAEVTGDVLV